MHVQSHMKLNAVGESKPGPKGNIGTTSKLLGKRSKIHEGPELEFFLANSGQSKISAKERLRIRKTSSEDHPYLTEESLRGDGKLGNIYIHVLLFAK